MSSAGIYKIKNEINGKVYIGQSSKIYSRWKQHMKLLIENSHENDLIQNDWNEYGAESFSFTILKVGKFTKSELLTLEKQFILDYNSTEIGYNKTKKPDMAKDLSKNRQKQGYILELNKLYPNIEVVGGIENLTNVKLKSMLKFLEYFITKYNVDDYIFVHNTDHLAFYNKTTKRYKAVIVSIRGTLYDCVDMGIIKGGCGLYLSDITSDY